MVGAGVDSKDTRRLVMVALRKAGYTKPRRKSINNNAEAGPSTPTPVEVLVSTTYDNHDCDYPKECEPAVDYSNEKAQTQALSGRDGEHAPTERSA